MGDFPGRPVVRLCVSIPEAVGLIPGRGTKVLRALQPGQITTKKKKKKKKIQYKSGWASLG